MDKSRSPADKSTGESNRNENTPTRNTPTTGDAPTENIRTPTSTNTSPGRHNTPPTNTATTRLIHPTAVSISARNFTTPVNRGLRNVGQIRRGSENRRPYFTSNLLDSVGSNVVRSAPPVTIPIRPVATHANMVMRNVGQIRETERTIPPFSSFGLHNVRPIMLTSAQPVTTPVRIVTTPPVNARNDGQRSSETENRKKSSSSNVVGESSHRRKKSRTMTDIMASSEPRPRLDALDTDIPTPCCICNKQFSSWKALFGHMRSHPERQWRGVFPPPAFDQSVRPGGQPLQIVPLDNQGGSLAKVDTDLAASTLLNLAKECIDKIGVAGSSSSASSKKKRIVFNVDLNVALEPVIELPETSSLPPPPPPPPPSAQRSPTPPPPENERDDDLVIDLNRSPPAEE